MDKLFRVTLQDALDKYNVSYVVAKDPTSAYEEVREYLQNNNLGLSSKRGLDSIELVAEDAYYPDCNHRLFIIY